MDEFEAELIKHNYMQDPSSFQCSFRPPTSPTHDQLCYVCLDGPPAPHSACVCVDRFLHPACQQRQIQTSGSTRCHVCLNEYENVKYSVEVVKQVKMSTVRLIGIVWVTILSSIVAIMCTTPCCNALSESYPFLTPLMFILPIILAISASLQLAVIRRNGYAFHTTHHIPHIDVVG